MIDDIENEELPPISDYLLEGGRSNRIKNIKKKNSKKFRSKKRINKRRSTKKGRKARN